jgi:elongation factor P--beta-lysine ligase
MIVSANFMTDFKPIFVREEVIKSTREFFYAKNFHEVIVPVLNDAVPLEPQLSPFTTLRNSLEGAKKQYLSLSPERGLKRMLATGMGSCFALGKSFRNLENTGTQHIPEFLMLEWYRENADCHLIMEDAEELILFIQKRCNGIASSFPPLATTSGWRRISLDELLKKRLGSDYERIMYDDAKGWRERFDQLFVNEIESRFPKEPFFLTDFPARISPLCKLQKERPQLAERFELYLNGVEVGNGNMENTDADSVRKALGEPVDETFLSALKKMSSKTYAGMGLGIDRLAMIFSGVKNIREVEILVQ